MRTALEPAIHKVAVVTTPTGATISIAWNPVGTTPAVVEMKGFSAVE